MPGIPYSGYHGISYGIPGKPLGNAEPEKVERLRMPTAQECTRYNTPFCALLLRRARFYFLTVLCLIRENARRSERGW